MDESYTGSFSFVIFMSVFWLSLLGLVFWFFIFRSARPIEKWSDSQLLSRIQELESDYKFLDDFFVGKTNGPIKRKYNMEQQNLLRGELDRRRLARQSS